MKQVIALLQHSKKEAEHLTKHELAKEISQALLILEGYEDKEKRNQEEIQLYRTLSTMSPWEQKQYIDSWNGHGS